jgi:hypothetical protein
MPLALTFLPLALIVAAILVALPFSAVYAVPPPSPRSPPLAILGALASQAAFSLMAFAFWSTVQSGNFESDPLGWYLRVLPLTLLVAVPASIIAGLLVWLSAFLWTSRPSGKRRYLAAPVAIIAYIVTLVSASSLFIAYDLGATG